MEPIGPDGPSATPADMPNDVLIVEDDAIIALDFEDTLASFGIRVIRIAATVPRALSMIAERAPDFALLDIGLSREKSFAVAERLVELKVGFAFVTGYSAGINFPPEYSGRPKLSKPYSRKELFAVLSDWRSTSAR